MQVYADVAGTVAAGPVLVAALIALVAGLVSFLSPCVLPLVPGYLSYVAGITGETVKASPGGTKTRQASGRARVLLGAALFVAGFSAVFISFGALFGGAGLALREHQTLITRILGVITIALGVAFLGKLPWMQREWRIHKLPATGLAGAPLLGIVFGLGWTPCLGPTLTAILGLSLKEGSAGRGAFLSVAYCIGLGVPFLLIAFGARWAMRASGFARKHAGVVMKFGGVMLIVLGILLVTGWWDAVLFQLQGWLATTGLGTLL
ncbi:cytochrome c-type biogenesis protein [Antricoccus suffuscus]|uniref:Cytochrome c-type biogenesis protein n=1 Tax=Antricoccus suffuscus TaxID=1629062 RepID=A0A2T0ZRU4_9ACTN|nr:cytochrome c biogenesis protein CcdA [Antricoccus suffuscus]PRZ39082.1 cytochrome c-type biogenesis protein [Antricoccus suffuscus]